MFQKADKNRLIEKEWKSFLKKEERLLKKYGKGKQSFIDQKLETVVPEGLQETLINAFYKAFQVIVQSGTGVIEKTYSKEKLEADFKLREYRQELHGTRKNLKAASKTAGMKTAFHVAGAGIEGVTLGFLGIGLPDIPLFLGAIFRSLYTLCLNYGIDYKKPQEQEILLSFIAQSLNRNEDFLQRDAHINQCLFEAVSGTWTEKTDSDALIRQAALALSGELLYLKFLQGIPIAGAIGGIYDGIYLKRITDYAAVKLERRYLLSKMFNTLVDKE